MAHLQTKVITVATFILMLCPSKAIGAEYLVQIGAFKNTTSEAKYADAEAIGGIHHMLSSDSWQKVLVGKFASLQDAKEARTELIDLGYSDAFLVAYSTISDRLNLAVTDSALMNTKKIRNQATSLDELSADERAVAVYLDGKLRMKRGDQFLTLEEYRQNR